MTAIELIAAERLRQMEVEKWTLSHDDKQNADQLALAAACYALPERFQYRIVTPRLAKMAVTMVGYLFPFKVRWWRPTPKDRVRELVKAGALIVAEIERLQRAELRK